MFDSSRKLSTERFRAVTRTSICRRSQSLPVRNTAGSILLERGCAGDSVVAGIESKATLTSERGLSPCELQILRSSQPVASCRSLAVGNLRTHETPNILGRGSCKKKPREDEMRSMKILLSSILLMGLIAVAQEPASTAAPAADAKPSKATVYVYRYKQFVGSALEPSVYCDEVQLARMTNGRYFTVKVDPGKHLFNSNDKQAGVELDAKAGQEYFIRVEIAAGMMKGHGRLIMMAPEQAAYELKSDKLKPLDPGKVANTTMVSTEQAHPGSAANGSQAPASQPTPKIVEVSSPQNTDGNSR